MYLIHGEEAYYIDELAKLFENILPESERDFNLHILYAPETTADAIADTCTRFPMMSERQVVIVKEAQNNKTGVLNKLADYGKSVIYHHTCNLLPRRVGQGSRSYSCHKEKRRRGF